MNENNTRNQPLKRIEMKNKKPIAKLTIIKNIY
jgi:hypothetical protein